MAAFACTIIAPAQRIFVKYHINNLYDSLWENLNLIKMWKKFRALDMKS